MNEFLKQAKHNKDFHECICANFQSTFFDWKITVVFYTALHYVKALASFKGIYIGKSHSEILRSINPNNKTSVVLHLSYSAWDNYKNLFQYCHSARYDGITDFDTWQSLKEADYKHCLQLLLTFESYIKSEKIPI
jgi:uncharacterized protein (UPF0332 family)